MKKTGAFIAGLFLSLAGMAQENKGGISDFMKEEIADFDKFMDDADKEFIDFMRNPWKEFESEKPVVKRVKPEPVEPVVYDESVTPRDAKPVCLTIEEILDMTTSEGGHKPVIQLNDIDKITFDKPEVIVKKKKDPKVIIIEEKTADKPSVQPEKEPVAKVPEPESVVSPFIISQPVVEPKRPAGTSVKNSPLYTAQTGRSKIAYVGESFYLSDALSGRCRLNGLDENAIADAYETLCSSDYKSLVADCGQIKKDLQLNDWGMFMLIRQISDTYCATANESVVMQQFLLNEMGYKARMARKATGDKVMLFVATDCNIYARPYITLEGRNYYNMSGDNAQCRFYMCPKDSPKAKKAVGMRLDATPNFSGTVTTSTRCAQGSAAKVTVDVSKTLVDFYKSYPQCDYSVYFNATVNGSVENKLISSLAPLLQGKSEENDRGYGEFPSAALCPDPECRAIFGAGGAICQRPSCTAGGAGTDKLHGEQLRQAEPDPRANKKDIPIGAPCAAFVYRCGQTRCPAGGASADVQHTGGQLSPSDRLRLFLRRI